MQIQELILLTNDITQTKKFYEKTMGFERMAETTNTITFRIGTSILKFELSETIQNPTYHFAFNIPANKISEAKDWLNLRTGLIKPDNQEYIANFETWKAQSIYFFDNNHNIVELIARQDLYNQTDAPFSIETILSLNEIGLVDNYPLHLAAELIHETGAEFFAKGPKRKDFVAIGDENGLFVISNSQRNWYPTTQKAQKHPLKAKISVMNQEYELEFV